MLTLAHCSSSGMCSVFRRLADEAADGTLLGYRLCMFTTRSHRVESAPTVTIRAGAGRTTPARRTRLAPTVRTRFDNAGAHPQEQGNSAPNATVTQPTAEQRPSPRPGVRRSVGGSRQPLAKPHRPQL